MRTDTTLAIFTIYELVHKEGWVLKNWCFQIVVLEKTLDSPLDSKEIKSVNDTGNQPWIFTKRTDAKAQAPYFGHLMWIANSLEKMTLMLGKIEGRRRRGVRGYNGWMASPMQWTWTWANFRRWWGTWRPGVPQFKGSQSQTQSGDQTTATKNPEYSCQQSC